MYNTEQLLAKKEINGKELEFLLSERKNEKVNLRFIFEVLQMIDYPLGDHKRHWIGEFQYLNIFVPNDENEQTRIADILTDMDEEISILKGKLIKAKQVKQGMMQNLLTGKIRLV